MISAYRAGFVAGSAAYLTDIKAMPYGVNRLAQETLEQRKRMGIAHFIPEQDFLRGFVEGYERHTEKPDGLCLYALNG